MAFDLKQRLTRDALSAARIAAASRSCRLAGEPTRAHQLGQLASEVLGSTATLEEFLVEWWDTYAVTHLRPNTLERYAMLLGQCRPSYIQRRVPSPFGRVLVPCDRPGCNCRSGLNPAGAGRVPRARLR
jgi:hypothetical protein